MDNIPCKHGTFRPGFITYNQQQQTTTQMKVHSKHIGARKSAVNAFTLIEMIGVLAVIAILASMLIPKIFEAINNARINNAAVSYNSVKTALADHYAKWGSLLSSNGTVFATTASVATNYDKMLVTEGFMDE